MYVVLEISVGDSRLYIICKLFIICFNNICILVGYSYIVLLIFLFENY